MRTKRDWLGPGALWLSALVVCAAPLVFGGVHALTQALLALGAMAALSLHCADRWRRRRPLLVPWTFAPVALATLATLLALIPLPELLRSLLDASSTEIKGWVAEGLSDDARRLVRPMLAVDPPEAALALLRLLAASAVFLVLVDRARADRTRRTLYRILTTGGAAIMGVAAFHALADLDAIYGVMKSQFATPLKSPLYNPNHLARIFGAFSFLAVAHLPDARSRVEAVMVATTAAVLGAGVFFTYSRGGMIVYAVTGLVAALFWLAGRRGAGSPEVAGDARASVIGPLVAVVAVGFAMWVARESLLDELATVADSDIETSKARLYGPALRLAADHAWLGVGPGGFRYAISTVVATGELAEFRFTHVENVLLQTLASHGFVFGAGLLALGALTGWHLLRRIPSAAMRGPLLVLAFLVLGDLFDFVLEIPAGLLVAAAALAIASAHVLNNGGPSIKLGRRGMLVALVVTLLFGAVAAVVALPDDRRRIDAQLEELSSGQERQAVLERAMARHPYDTWYAYGLARERRAARDAEGALQWANRALVLDPNNGSAHIEAARVLWAAGRIDQALVEYRTAWRVAPGLRDRVVTEVARRTKRLDLRLAAVPPNDRRGFDSICTRYDREEQLADALACWDAAAKAFPDEDGVVLAAAKVALRLGDAAGARARLAPLVEKRPLHGSTARLFVDALAATAGFEAAYEESKRLRPDVAAGKHELLRWQLYAARRLGRFAEALGALQEARAGADLKQTKSLEHDEAALLEAMGKKGDALMMWKKIADRSPRSTSARANQARLELDLGMLDHAAASIRRLESATPPDRQAAQLRSRLEALQAATREREMQRTLSPARDLRERALREGGPLKGSVDEPQPSPSR